MGLTERHWFENEDVPENYEWALEDAVYNSRTTGEGGKMRVTDRSLIKAELQNLQSVLEHQAEMSIGSGKMRLLSFAHACSGALELLKEQPIVHGRWVKMTGMMPPEYHGHYECSECRWHMRGPRDSLRKEEELSYCPNCGAKMDLENKNNVGK